MTTESRFVEDEGGGLPLRDAGVACGNCGSESRRPASSRCAGCGRFAPDPRYAYSPMTGTWYRVWEWDDAGGGRIIANRKEEVDRSEVPERWLDRVDEREVTA